MNIRKLISMTQNEIILIAGTTLSIAILAIQPLIDVYAFWLSLACIVGVSLYYSLTFFSSTNMGYKLYYFAASLVLIICYFAAVYKLLGIIDTTSDKEVNPSWLTSFYFSVVTWSTLGFGDYKPNQLTQVWVMAEALMGNVFMGLLIAKIIIINQVRLPKEKE